MRSPVWEAMADEVTGVASPKLLKLMEDLSRGGVGLIIPGYVYVSKTGKAITKQTGLFNHETANVWKDTIERIHGNGSKFVFQICHGGNDCQPALIGDTPRGCSESPLIPGTRSMTIVEIEDTIQAFINSAKLASSVGADGVELHGAHGYLLSEFLSPAINRRTDKYGGTLENRLRIVQEITAGIRSVTDRESFTIGIKMNGHDFLDGGVTPELAAKHVHELNGIDFFEISCGFWNVTATIRSIPRDSIFKGLSKEEVEQVKQTIKKEIPGVTYRNSYTLDLAEIIKSANPDRIIGSVGGHRELSEMNNAISSGKVDIISMARPFIREPHLVKMFERGEKTRAGCISCGECIWRPQGPSGVRCSWTT
jgi:2,4-dienoyl-CoA reductase-like NADH-dependent reductase (Old Yellow Enzyme family)